jgi:polysaccharide export outer membrane protein
MRQMMAGRVSKLLRAASAGAALALLGACTSAPPAPGVSVVGAVQDDAALRRANELEAATAASRYLLQPGDELELRFADYPQYDQTAKVRPDGKISLQLVGAVYVQGRTPEDVQQELTERYVALAGQAGAERSYLIRPSDEFEIKFPYQPTLNEVVKVRPDGKVALQLVGTVVAQGMSPEELQAELTKRYAKVLRAPELAVIMRSFSSQSLRVGGGNGRAGAEYLRPVVMLKQGVAQQVFVGGEVQRPGMLPYRPGMTLMQALMEAGSYTTSAELRSVLVLRKSPGSEALVIRRDLAADLRGDTTNDIALQPSDVVLLPLSSIASVGIALDQYLFKLFPPLRNSSFGFTYDLRRRSF